MKFIVPRALELIYTASDSKPLARDVWQSSSPKVQYEIVRRWEQAHRTKVMFPGDFSSPNLEIPPFPWNEERRAVIRTKLDAYYARLYGLTRDELRYRLDPQDVHGPDFPGETFRVLKEKEQRLYGEYRTKRLVLEAWDQIEGTVKPEDRASKAKPAVVDILQKVLQDKPKPDEGLPIN